MDPETVINLFDSYWFHHEILTKNPSVLLAKTNESEPRFSSLRSLLVRSQSEDIGSSFNYGSFSPNSVLKPILPSRKSDFQTKKQEQVQEVQEQVTKVQESEAAKGEDHIRQPERKRSKKRRKGTSKSLSELEFEELKGFMDIGFVFSEQDKDSRLVEILPGLQRLGKNDDIDEENDDNNDDGGDGGGRRPYLSEAWVGLDQKLKKEECKKVLPVMKWEIPAVGDEIDMKDNLKLWAHKVASIVR